MANWFKIYETDLDEKRLKYALNKLPEVGWVWIGILSECCKHRSDTIRYSQREVDLFGFSDALKVSIPKINESFLLLAEIEYIELLDGKIRVIKWDSKQSEYNHRKTRGDYRRVSESIGEYPLEERRGEEKRREERESAHAVRSVREEANGWSRGKRDELMEKGMEMVGKGTDANIPTKPEVIEYAKVQGIPEPSATSFFDHHEGNSLWLNQHGRLIKWQVKLKAWSERDRTTPVRCLNTNGQNKRNGEPILSDGARVVVHGKELERVIERIKTIKSTYGDHQTWTEADRKEFAKLRARRDELRKELGVVV